MISILEMPAGTVVGLKPLCYRKVVRRERVMDSLLEAIGETPMIRLRRMVYPGSAEVLVKFEAMNVGGSVKTRTAYGMICDAEREGLLGPGSTVVEYTSGNQGIALALICAVKGYRCKLVMPETMSEERRVLMEAYGAEIVLTPAGESISETIDICVRKAKELTAQPGHWLADQFRNPSNPRVHFQTTAREILYQVDRTIDAFCAGVGTGGTFTGVGRALRQTYPAVRLYAVEPDRAAILSGGQPMGHHSMQGMGDGLVPEVLDRSLIDDVIVVTDDQALDTARRLAREEGLLVGPSSGANVWAALQVAEQLGEGKTVVTLLPDTGERYISTGLFRKT